MIESLMILSYLLAEPFGNPYSEIPLRLQSPAFDQHNVIPDKYTCYGKKLPIPLSWSGVPKGTRSLAIIMIDQDTPRQKKHYHWAIFNIPPQQTTLSLLNHLTSNNSWHHQNYQPPCPRSGIHHYAIRLYVLNVKLPQSAHISPIELQRDMRHHIIASTELVGQVKGS
jgi:Raf kinase inhibitor-like YbhB/YbcL family protein